MAKFFNEGPSQGGNNNFVEEPKQESKFFNNNMPFEQEVEEEESSFVSAADASLEAQQVPHEEEVQEVYSEETDSSEFNDGFVSPNEVGAEANNDGFVETLDNTEVNEVLTMEKDNNQINNEQYFESDVIDNNSFQEPMDKTSFDQIVNEEKVNNQDKLEQSEIANEPSVVVDNSISGNNSYDEPINQGETNNEGNEVLSSGNDTLSAEQVFVAPPIVNNEENQTEPFVEETSQVASEETSVSDNSVSENKDSNTTNNSFVVDDSYKGVDNTGKTGEEIQNPVYIDGFEKNDVNVSGNIIAVLLVLFEVLLSPGKSVIRNTEKYIKGKKAFKVFVNVIIYEFIFAMIGHVVGGCFVNKMFNGEYRKVFDFSNVSHLNYLNIIISSVIVIFGLVILISLINYASSFFNNKGLSFDTYLLIAVLSFFPLVLAINTLVPMLNVMSIYLSIGVVAISLIYSLLIYVNALWGIMEFKTDNGKVMYLLVNFTLVIVVLVIALLVFFEDYVNGIIAVFK